MARPARGGAWQLSQPAWVFLCWCCSCWCSAWSATLAEIGAAGSEAVSKRRFAFSALRFSLPFFRLGEHEGESAGTCAEARSGLRTSGARPAVRWRRGGRLIQKDEFWTRTRPRVTESPRVRALYIKRSLPPGGPLLLIPEGSFLKSSFPRLFSPCSNSALAELPAPSAEVLSVTDYAEAAPSSAASAPWPLPEPLPERRSSRQQ